MSVTMPYTKWYARDWLGDQLVRMMSLEERGVWIDLLNVMMMSDPYGYLAVNGRPMTDEEAARLIGCDIGTYKGCIDKLSKAGVPSYTPEGMMFSRRLVRDHERFLKASEAGHKGGGNPLLKEKKPEARSQKPEAREPIKAGYKPPFIGQEGEEKPQPARRSACVSQLPDFPKLATIPGFPEAFDAWRTFRKSKRAPVTDRVERVVLTRLTERPGAAIAALDTCMAAGWTDVRWDWIDNRNAKQAPQQPSAPSSGTRTYLRNQPQTDTEPSYETKRKVDAILAKIRKEATCTTNQPSSQPVTPAIQLSTS